MASHLYSIGQKVSFDRKIGAYLKRGGVFTITKLLPPSGTELQYRVKSDGETHERVASEHELHVVELEKPIVGEESRLSQEEANAASVFAGLS